MELIRRKYINNRAVVKAVTMGIIATTCLMLLSIGCYSSKKAVGESNNKQRRIVAKSKKSDGYYPSDGSGSMYARIDFAQFGQKVSTENELRQRVQAPFRLPASDVVTAEGYWYGGATDGSESAVYVRYPEKHIMLLIAIKGGDPNWVTTKLSETSAPGLAPFTDGRKLAWRRGSVGGKIAAISDPGTQTGIRGKISNAARIVWFSSGCNYNISSFEASVEDLQEIADSMY